MDARIDWTLRVEVSHAPLKYCMRLTAARRYVINGRSPLEWFIDRYRVKTDRGSGIVNDPNRWFKDPRDFVEAFKRIVHVGVEPVRIVESLPDPFLRETSG